MKSNGNFDPYDHIIGMDEVGRGAIAGAVAVGAVSIDREIYKNKHWDSLADSKKLTPKKREVWCEYIKDSNFKTAVEFISAEEIDEVGIMSALKKASDKCLEKLINDKKCIILSDYGLPVDKIYKNISIKKGDESEPVIAFASILAKVMRDKYMIEQSQKYNNYEFENNKGYGTSIHIDLIKKYGICPLHRKSFCESFNPNP